MAQALAEEVKKTETSTTTDTKDIFNILYEYIPIKQYDEIHLNFLIDMLLSLRGMEGVSMIQRYKLTQLIDRVSDLLKYFP